MLSASADEAAAKANALLAAGRRIDLELYQISSGQGRRRHLTTRLAFEECANAAAGVNHLADDYQAVLWELAHRRYSLRPHRLRRGLWPAYRRLGQRQPGCARGARGARAAATPTTLCPAVGRMGSGRLQQPGARSPQD